MRRTKTQFAPLILLVALNCTKNKPTGATPAQGPSAQSVPQEVEPQESAQRTPAYGGGYGDPGKGGGKGDMPPEKGELEITITHLNSESWNNNCLSFGVGYVDKNGQSVETPLVRAGCSKDPDILNKKIILKGYAGVCNRVRFVLQSFPPDLTNCPHNSPCGHFQKHPKVVRSSKNPHDLIAFFAYNVAKNLPNNHFIQVKAFKRDLIADYEEAQSYSGGKVGGWIRILFEDQPTHNILEAINNPSSPTLHKKLGVDFNDAAVDVRSKDVRFSLQNSGGIRAPTWKYVWDEYAGRRVKLKPLGCEKDTSPHPTEPKPYPGKGDNKPPKDPGDHPPLNG